MNYDEESGFSIKGRDHRRSERTDDRVTQVQYSRGNYSYSDVLRYDQERDERDPPYRGEDDVSLDKKPWTLLLVRNLKDLVTEEVLAKGLEKLNRNGDSPTGATEGSLRRAIIIRDRKTDRSLRFGFAEYHKVDDAIAALAKAGELGEKCTISSQTVDLSIPHLGVFPTEFSAKGRSDNFTIVMPKTGQRHMYHDDRYYPSELLVNEYAPYRRSSSSKNGSGGFAGQPAGSNALESKGKSRKRKAPDTATAPAPVLLQLWQNKGAELRSEDDKESELKKRQPPARGVNAIATPMPPALSESDQQTFSVDTQKKKCCYLCFTQFPTLDKLQRHLKESLKHASNLEESAAKEKGYERMNNAGVAENDTIKLLVAAPSSTGARDAMHENKQYRDRAAERRKETAQQTDMSMKGRVSFSLKAKAAPVRPSSSSSSGTEPPKPLYGKGLDMLHKAGWTADQGLGSDGSGVKAPIDQMVYAAGVGLGHEGGKKGDAVEEAARMTKGGNKGDTGFLEGTRELARQRYERME